MEYFAVMIPVCVIMDTIDLPLTVNLYKACRWALKRQNAGIRLNDNGMSVFRSDRQGFAVLFFGHFAAVRRNVDEYDGRDGCQKTEAQIGSGKSGYDVVCGGQRNAIG